MNIDGVEKYKKEIEVDLLTDGSNTVAMIVHKSNIYKYGFFYIYRTQEKWRTDSKSFPVNKETLLRLHEGEV